MHRKGMNTMKNSLGTHKGIDLCDMLGVSYGTWGKQASLFCRRASSLHHLSVENCNRELIKNEERRMDRLEKDLQKTGLEFPGIVKVTTDGDPRGAVTILHREDGYDIRPPQWKGF